MLRITIPSVEYYDEIAEEFVTVKGQTIQLEHSLVSISKWESKWCKSFFSREEKTVEETVDYIKCMTLTQNVNPLIYNHLTQSNMDDVNEYIEAPMTATVFYDDNSKKGGRGETVTSELIYYWMVALNIPFECQKWHLNRLLTLVKVCNIKNSPPKKMSRKELMSRNASINAARKQKLNTKG